MDHNNRNIFYLQGVKIKNDDIGKGAGSSEINIFVSLNMPAIENNYFVILEKTIHYNRCNVYKKSTDSFIF